MSDASVSRGGRPISVLLVNGLPEARQLLRAALSAREELDVVGEAEDGASAIALAAALRPGVVVLDLGLPELAGREVIARLHEISPVSKVVVLTAASAAVEGALARADAFVFKDIDVKYLVDLLTTLSERSGRDAEVYLAAEPASVGAARAFARSVLPIWELAELCDDVVLVVSELVTNAFVHGRSPCRLRLSASTGRVRVEVLDEGAGAPDLCLSSSGSLSGRGLYLVAHLAAAWGTEPLPAGGKLVWAELAQLPVEDIPEGEVLA